MNRTSDTAPLIQVHNLCKTFQMGRQAVHALVDLDIMIAPNTFTVVMGPSGSGKSTLLYLLGGLDRPSSGTIVVGGQAIDQLDENALARFRQKFVGFIFQSFNLVASMTALENVAFPLRFTHMSGKERQRKARELLQRVGLQDRAYHRPTELSGGQQQRVAIARALINNPDIILADEPTGNLDTVSGFGIMQLLGELHRSGRTVIVVTHDPRMRQFATEVTYLLDGRLVSENDLQAANILSTSEAQAA